MWKTNGQPRTILYNSWVFYIGVSLQEANLLYLIYVYMCQNNFRTYWIILNWCSNFEWLGGIYIYFKDLIFECHYSKLFYRTEGDEKQNMRCCGGFFLGLWGDVPRKKKMEHQFNANSRILKWRYVSTIFLAIICGDIPVHRPYIGLIYGSYLQFRILKWPLINWKQLDIGIRIRPAFLPYWLVVWNMAFIFPYIVNFIIPTDFHIFSEGLKPPTRFGYDLHFCQTCF